MGHENTVDSFITLNSIKKASGRKFLVNNEINFKSKYNYLKPKLPLISQERLIDIALNDKSWQIRRLALKHIKNINTVFKIAFNDKSPHVKVQFLKYFNPEALKYVALTNPSVNVRKHLINYVTDVKLLKYLALNDSSKVVRSKASEKIDDSNFLKELINSNVSHSTKQFIIKKIDDDKFLFDFFNKTDDDKIKLAIIEAISDHDLIVLLYKMSDYYYRTELVKKLDVTDVDMLLKCFEFETDMGLKELIFSKFSNQMAEHLFLIDDEHQFCARTIKNIDNQEILIDAIYGNYIHEIKLNAIENLNQKNLLKICNDLSLNEDLRVKAVSEIENEDYLIEICENTHNVNIILSALSNIKNQDFIKKYGLNNENWKIRSLAIAKIEDEELLFLISLNETYLFSRKLAIGKIQDDERLVEILKNENDYSIQKLIVNSIESHEILLNLLKSGYIDLIDVDENSTFLKNDDILTIIAQKHKNILQQAKAVELIENEEILKHIVLNAESEEIKELALVENTVQYQKAKKGGYFNYELTLRFLDEYIFYEYLKNLNVDSPHIKRIVIKLIEEIQDSTYLRNLAFDAKDDYVACCAIASDNFDMDFGFSDDELISLSFKIAIGFEKNYYFSINKYRTQNIDEKSLISKIRDESKLLSFILSFSHGSDFNNEMLYNALDYIINEEYLYEIALSNHLNLSLKNIAVSRITNQDMLEEIVLNHPNVYVRNQAIINIKNTNLIKSLALNAPSNIIRKSALLWNAYEDDKFFGIRPTGDSKVSILNEEDLEEIVLKSDDKRIRSLAFKMINDIEIISRIAEKSRDVEIRNSAVQFIQNQSLLIKIALNDPSRIVKTSAIDAIDEENLVEILDELRDWYLRSYALNQIYDERTIIDFAVNDSNWHVRHIAVSKINNENILKEIALNDSNINIRKTAIRKIASKDVLKEISSKTTHYTTPAIVEKRLMEVLE